MENFTIENANVCIIQVKSTNDRFLGRCRRVYFSVHIDGHNIMLKSGLVSKSEKPKDIVIKWVKEYLEYKRKEKQEADEMAEILRLESLYLKEFDGKSKDDIIKISRDANDTLNSESGFLNDLDAIARIRVCQAILRLYRN